VTRGGGHSSAQKDFWTNGKHELKLEPLTPRGGHQPRPQKGSADRVKKIGIQGKPTKDKDRTGKNPSGGKGEKPVVTLRAWGHEVALFGTPNRMAKKQRMGREIFAGGGKSPPHPARVGDPGAPLVPGGPVGGRGPLGKNNCQKVFRGQRGGEEKWVQDYAEKS